MSEILLNKKRLEEMSGRFEGISVKIIEAAQYTERSQSLEHDKNTCGETVKGYSIQTEKIKKSFRLIIDSFTSEDEKLKKKAEEIVGPQYDKINAGYSIVYDKDGNVVEIRADYSQAVQKYIFENLKFLLDINASNRTKWLRDGEWCDAYVDYILKQSGVPSPGDTNDYTTMLFEMNDWRHGYKFDNGDWSEFNNSTPTPGGARISNDGYKQKTGDLVWGSKNLVTEHVGIYYVDPISNEAYVLEGNVPDTNMTPAQEFYNRYRHVSFGDLGAYINSLS